LAPVLLGIEAVNATLSCFQRYLSQWIASHIGYDLRNRLYDHIQHLSFSIPKHAQGIAKRDELFKLPWQPC
jgi:ABC-type multidrug transport system fused ATPase/permease subunit